MTGGGPPGHGAGPGVGLSANGRNSLFSKRCYKNENVNI